MAVKVTIKNKKFNGKIAGVQFKNGVGIFENEDVGKRHAHMFGHTVEPYDPEQAEPFEMIEKESVTSQDYSRLTKKEQMQLLEERNVDFKETETKKELEKKLRLTEQ